MKRLATPRWLLLHAVVVVLVGVFLGLGWWQLGRAEQGNALSFGYTLEWPFFAAFVIFMWVREMRLALGKGSARTRTAGETPDGAADGTPESTDADRSLASTATTDPAGVTSFDVTAALTRRASDQRTGIGIDAASDYNQYLAWLAANPTARPRDYVSRADAAPSGTEKTETAHG